MKELDDITAPSAVTTGPPPRQHLTQPQQPPQGQAQGLSNTTTTNVSAQTQTNNINIGSSETQATTSSPLTSTVQNT